MSLHKTYRLLIMMLAGWFLAMQSFSMAHASAYGDNPHEHEGVACAVTVLADHNVVPMPDCPDAAFACIFESEKITPIYHSAFYLSPQGRAPPPRAPPFTL